MERNLYVSQKEQKKDPKEFNEHVLNNLKQLIGTEFDSDEVICCFDLDCSEYYESDYIFVNESMNNGYDFIAYVNDECSDQFLFTVDENNIILDVWMA